MAEKLEHTAEEVFESIAKFAVELDASSGDRDFGPRAAQAVFKGAGSLGRIPSISPDLWILLINLAIMVLQYILKKLEGKGPG